MSEFTLPRGGQDVKLTHLSLFSGIGGFDLSAHRAGFQTVALVEISPFCQQVLRQHFPQAVIHDDVTSFGPEHAAALGPITLLSGGFPCQDLSYEGAGAGLSGARSGLWGQMVRTIRLVGPRYVLVENVAALLDRGLDTVLGDLAEGGYDAEWDCLPAGAFGAPHFRNRVFVVAHPHCDGLQGGNPQTVFGQSALPRFEDSRGPETWRGRSDLFEPKLLRTLAGVPSGVDRAKAIGNAVSPVVAEWICHQIRADHERGERA